jgi:hypothetical protein
MAQAVVEELKREVHADPEASNRRIKAAKERAARERSERVKAAQTALAEIKRKREELAEKGGNGKKPKEPRASTTDTEARVMKMADGGFRPGYNVQVVSVAGEQIVVAIEVGNNGSDHGLMRPARCGAAYRNAISLMAALAAPRTLSGRIAKASRSTVHPSNPRRAPTPTYRGAVMAQG